MNRIIFFSLLSFCVISCGKAAKEVKFKPSVSLPIAQNTWISHDQKTDGKIIKKDGVRNWDGTQPLETYFRTDQSGKIKLGLNLKSISSEVVKIKVSLGGKSHKIIIKNHDFRDVYVGGFDLKNFGYQKVIIEKVNPDASADLQINKLLLTGPATEGKVIFVKDNFHFGRRGPSVHLRYPVPEEGGDPVYFYNEIEVPEGNDIIGSYFMANGFAYGYFGMQVNSESERRILFSVWSPYDTQNPDEIPKNQRIKLLKKGDGVHAGKFGNEGSGGQSYKKYIWKAATTYRFLLKGEPADETHTDYSAYFFTPEKGQWELIASFRRPKSGNYLGSLYSFLENFVPATGDTTRKAFYKNQWIYTTNDRWTELTKAEFTTDATAKQEDRLDYAGGVNGDAFYLKNCGFFDETTKTNTYFDRQTKGKHPIIDFSKLP